MPVCRCVWILHFFLTARMTASKKTHGITRTAKDRHYPPRPGAGIDPAYPASRDATQRVCSTPGRVTVSEIHFGTGTRDAGQACLYSDAELAQNSAGGLETDEVG